jgi:hypothetical protein
MFQAIGVRSDILEAARVRRVTHYEAGELCGIRYKSSHLEGIGFPYLDPVDDRVVGWSVRRDNPEVETSGTPVAKYIFSLDRKRLYFAPGSYAQLGDTSSPVIIVEAQKSVLSIASAVLRTNRTPRPLVIGLSGCWGWKGIVGKSVSPSGARVDMKGVLPDFDKVSWTGRDTIIIFDSNAVTNEKVQAARHALAAELTTRGARVRVVDLIEPNINGPDDFIGKQGDAAFWALVDSAEEEGDDDGTGRGGGSRRGPSVATQLVDLALDSGVELWHTPTGDAFGTIQVDGHREHHPLRRVVRDYLSRAYFVKTRSSPASAALADALGTLGGMARYDGAEHATAVRMATHHDSTIYVDLGDPAWRAIAIDANNWQVVNDAPARYWRPSSLRALPVPDPGGALDGLRELWPNVDDDAWTLIASWLVSTMAPAGPFPVLVEVGEQGSGKSTLGRMLRNLTDPASPSLRGVPRDERDVMIGALTSHVVALDNLSGLPAWLSDALCRIATGGGLATRTLYTDLDETLIDVMKPILLTGIDSPATRGDLVDRALVVALPAMADEARGDEAALWQRYAAIRPQLVGALCSAASMALRRRAEVQLARRPRMADACIWVTAAEPALGWHAGRTSAAWMGARQHASADLVAGDPVAQALLTMPMTTNRWEGMAADLLAILNKGVSENTRSGKTWPTSARGLSGAIRRLAPDLRRVGLDVQLPSGARTGRERTITIRQTRVEQDTQDRPDTSSKTLSKSAAPACPVACPVEPIGHPTGQRQDATGQRQDTNSINESGPLSDVSDLSCSAHPDHTDVAGVGVDDDDALF